MGEKTNTTPEGASEERRLGQMLFDRYPHVVPSPTWMSCIVALVDEHRPRPGANELHPLAVLEAWFDCWAALAFREAAPVGSLDMSLA